MSEMLIMIPAVEFDRLHARIAALERGLREIIKECAEGNEFDRWIVGVASAALDKDAKT